MENKCETIGKYLMPLFRSMVAKELVDTHELTQSQASKILGTTQAAVSQYINSKRATIGIEKYSHVLPKIQKRASKTAKDLAEQKTNWKEVTAGFCTFCFNILDEETNNSSDNYNI